MNADDFRSLSVPELEARIADMRKDLFNFRMQLHSNQLSNVNRIRETRHDIARAMTVKKELLSKLEEQS